MSARLKAVVRTRAARDVWDDAVAEAGERMKVLTRRFAAGALTEADYVAEMRALVKAVHMGAAAVGSGGIPAVPASELRRLGPVLRDEYRHLRRKVGRIQTGATSIEQELATVGQYANRARGTFENVAVRASGHTEVRRIIHSGESCTAGDGRPGCEEQAARGWHDVRTFVPIHKCRCRSACRCTVETRQGPG